MQKPFWELVVTAVVLFSCAGFAAAAMPADAAALLAFKAKADPGNRLAFHMAASDNSSAGHCRWPGVACSSSGRVVRFVLEGIGITGGIATGTIDRLDQLRILSLKGNSLAGPIPDISRLLNLKSLFLGGNRLGGPFPASVLSLHRLRTLDLSYNHLAGLVPPELAGLDRLNSLHLEGNRFNGAIPAFNQTSLKNFNVSYNNFSGAIPATTTLSSFDSSAFAFNPGLCGEVIRKECGAHLQFFHGGGRGNGSRAAPSPASALAAPHGGILLPGASTSSPSRQMHKKAVVAIGFLAGSLLVIGVLGAFLVMQKRRRRMKQGEILSPVKYGANGVSAVDAAAAAEANMGSYSEEIESGNNELMAAAAIAMSEEKVKKLAKSGCLVFCAGEVQVYTLEQLMKSSAEMLGRGRLGTTYKAVLESRLVVTVKRLDAGKLAATGKEAFERHMEVVGRLRHPNLVPLRAYFQAKEERLLVYDYQPNGSLHSLIHGSRASRPKPLHWTSCLKIAEDVAQGLAYIHQASRLVHGNIKSSNVLLGSDFEACLTDNCLSFLAEPTAVDEASAGYRAPETHYSSESFSPRSDIYSYGVLLLELLTGKPPAQHPPPGTTDLPAWVQSTRDDGADDERLMMITEIAAVCVQPSPDGRPTTWQVLKMIQEVKEADAAGDNESDVASLS